jgi:tetratricopeptide (TPR) repeat protein
MFRRTVVIGMLIALSTMCAGQPAPEESEGVDRQEDPIAYARQQWENNRVADALDTLRRVIQAQPNNIEANLLAGEILVANNDYNLARDYFRRVLGVEEFNFEANLGYARILLATRSVRQAAAYLERAESVAPHLERSTVKRLLAQAYAGMGNIDRAIAKAEEAVQADPEDLDALRTLVEVRRLKGEANPGRLQTALEEAERLVNLTTTKLVSNPWDTAELARLRQALDLYAQVLQTYHNSFYQRDFRGEPLDELRPGRGPDAAAALMRTADVVRQKALLDLIFAEHQSLLFVERAASDAYAPNNPAYLEQLIHTCAQVQDLTARLLGDGVFDAPAMRDKAVEAARHLIEIDPNNELAQQVLGAAGVPPTTQPAAE